MLAARHRRRDGGRHAEVSRQARGYDDGDAVVLRPAAAPHGPHPSFGRNPSFGTLSRIRYVTDAPRLIRTADLLIRRCRRTLPSVLIGRNRYLFPAFCRHDGAPLKPVAPMRWLPSGYRRPADEHWMPGTEQDHGAARHDEESEGAGEAARDHCGRGQSGEPEKYRE